MILFADFDGTLYFRDNQEKTDANLNAIKNWRASGHQFCITTGRSYRSVTKELPQIKELSDYYIVDSGSIILSQTGAILETFYFDPKLIPGITEFFKNLPEKSIPLYYTPNSENTIYETKHITKLRFWFKNLDQFPEIIKQLEKSFPVLAFKQKAFSEKKELLGQIGFIEIIPIEYGKSHAIKVLAKKANILDKDIIAVGDGSNDYRMVRDFHGFAIKNSNLSKIHQDLSTTVSVSWLIQQLLQNLA